MHSFLEVLQNFSIRHPVPISLNKKRESVVSHNQENYWRGSQDQKNYSAPGPATSGFVQAVLSEALVDISSSQCLSFLASFLTIAVICLICDCQFFQPEEKEGLGLVFSPNARKMGYYARPGLGHMAIFLWSEEGPRKKLLLCTGSGSSPLSMPPISGIDRPTL